MLTVRQLNAQWGSILKNNAQAGEYFRKNDAQWGINI